MPPIPRASQARYGYMVHVPELVRASVLRRIGRLEREERAVLMRASVIGRRFNLRVLLATTARSERGVRAALERACGLQLIVADGPHREWYAFRHALTRDIVYAEFLSVRVRPLHRRIARALEGMNGSEGVPLEDLAYHSWAGGDVKRALRYNELAGDNAAAVHAEDEARVHYSRARSLTDVESLAYVRLSEKLRAVGSP